MLIEPRKFDEPLPQNILNIEDKKRSNLFAWNGQFSPQLIENLLLAYCPRDATILDPFAGSGTVLYEAGCLTLKARGFDVNPAAWILGRTYQLMNMPQEDRDDLLSCVKTRLLRYFPEPDIFELVETRRVDPIAFLQALRSIYAAADADEIMVLDSLVILLDVAKHDLTKERIHSTLFKLSKLIRELPYSEELLEASLADARRLPIEDGVVDFVVTSPPYINVFNYHQNYRRSAEILEWNLLKVAKSEIGSNRANRGNRFLTVVQYCLDMALALRELCRVCTDSSKLIFVVGHESNVLGVPFFNAAIISRIAIESGVLRPCLNQKRIFKNRFGRHIREDLLHLVSNGSQFSLDHADEIGRHIASSVLQRGFVNVSEKNRKLIEDALDRIPDVTSTPIWDTPSHYAKGLR